MNLTKPIHPQPPPAGDIETPEIFLLTINIFYAEKETEQHFFLALHFSPAGGGQGVESVL